MSEKRSIVLKVTHPSGKEGRIEGFRFLWAFYVRGYLPEKHCQPCFIGARVPEFCTPTATSGRSVVFDRMAKFPFLYLCGVAAGPKSERGPKNLHLPLKYLAGGVVELPTYNDYQIKVENAERVEVPALADDWQGLPREHARCKNFQFAVEAFGYPPS